MFITLRELITSQMETIYAGVVDDGDTPIGGWSKLHNPYLASKTHLTSSEPQIKHFCFSSLKPNISHTVQRKGHKA